MFCRRVLDDETHVDYRILQIIQGGKVSQILRITPDKISIAIQMIYSQQSCTQVLIAGYFKLIHHCTFRSFLMVRLGVSHVYRVVYAHERIFFLKINGVGKPQKFSSELELACPSAKLFHLKQFAIYSMCQDCLRLHYQSRN